MENEFSWIPIYKEIAQKLLSFQNNREGLLEILYDIKNDPDNDIELNSLKDKNTENGKDKKLTDIDPFTFYACFNGGISTDTKRKQFLKSLKSKFNLESDIPGGYKGIPLQNPQKLMFFNFQYHRNSGAIDKLWELFIDIMESDSIDNISDNLFNKILTQGSISITNLTMGLYWIKPNQYISLDKKNRKYLDKKFDGIDANNIDSYDTYKNLLSKLSSVIQSEHLSIPKLSYAAHRIYSDKVNINYWKVAPGRNAQYWDQFKNNNIIAINWDEYNEYGSLKGRDKDEIANRLDLSPHSNILYAFNAMVNKMQIGDIIVANKGQDKIVGIGRVESNYIYDDSREKNRHQRMVDWFYTGDKLVDYTFATRTITTLDQEDYKHFKKLYHVQLGSPFDNIFPNYKKANKSFNLIKETFDRLELDINGQLYSITYRKKSNRLHLIRLNAGNFAILHYKGRENNDYRIGLSLLDNDQSFETKKVWDPFDSFDKTIRITEFSLEQFESQKERILNTYYKTLNYIREYLNNWSKSGYRRHNRPEIAEAIFSQEKREKLLKSGLEMDTEQNYFWITANPSIWSPEDIKEEGEVFYTAVNPDENKRRIYSLFEEAKPGDKVVFYESTPNKRIVATGEITKGLHKEYEEEHGEKVEGISIKYKNELNGAPWNVIKNDATLQDASPVKNKAQGSLFELSKDEYEQIRSLDGTNYSDFNQQLSVDKLSNDQKIELDNLYFEDKDKLLDQIHTALKTGKHIILNGPPGTGKSKLARQICEHYSPDGYEMATATSDWSTFDTIGGLMPVNNGDELKFNKGLFLKCFQNEHGDPDNKWLLLDEINRADIDKAFGALFSALTGDTITLSQKIEEDNIEILGDPEDNDKVESHKFFIHPDWRIIATMNTFDKTSLYEMSYAFMRRFAFINIGVPDEIESETVGELLGLWENDNFSSNSDNKKHLAELWETINNYREIGPSIVEDVANYVANGGDYIDAIGMYVIPQFEGLQDKDLEKFYSEINNDIDFINNPEKLKKVMSDFFEIDPKEFENG